MESFLASIPTFGEKVTIIDYGKRHSKRHIYDLYPAVTGLWIDELAHRSVSRDIIDYLSEALDYIDRGIMRMSILLSAISAEMLLADLYEELSKEEAPSAPIGSLIEKINAIRQIPKEAMSPLTELNAMRKAAVHRGIISLTRQDAIFGLMCAIKFLLWYAFESGKFYCVSKRSKEK